MDLLGRTVARGNAKIDLQPREFRLLEYLMRHAGQVVTRTMLLEQVWDMSFDPTTSVVETHISRLRAKVDKPFEEALIRTRRGATGGNFVNRLSWSDAHDQLVTTTTLLMTMAPMPAETVAEAFRRLEAGDEVVLGPSEDGGYYLIAVRREALTRELFSDIAWSTETVFSSTVARCEALGLRWSQLEMGTDVDLPADLERLRGRQESSSCRV